MTTAARRGTLLGVLALYLIGLAFVGVWPTPVDRPLAGLLKDAIDAVRVHPLTSGITYMHVEGAANLLLFVPFGVIVALILPTRRWWLAAVGGALTSAAIETIQYLALSQRHASLGDVLNNTVGALIGAAAIRIIRTHPAREPRPRPAAGPATAEAAVIGDGK